MTSQQVEDLNAALQVIHPRVKGKIIDLITGTTAEDIQDVINAIRADMDLLQDRLDKASPFLFHRNP